MKRKNRPGRVHYELLTEMEMRSAHASYCSTFPDTKKNPNVWLPWSWKWSSSSPITFCLRMLYDWKAVYADESWLEQECNPEYAVRYE